MLNRRDVLQLAVSAGAVSVQRPIAARITDEKTTRGLRIIDTNVSLFHWPFRRLPLDETDLLVKKIRALGITQAWAGSFEGILHRDVAGVNSRLAESCRGHVELVPIGSINPQLPGWQDDLRRCVDVHNMPGLRLYPNYHGYTLRDPAFEELLRLATASHRFVQIAVAMEDTRTQHPALQVPDVDVDPLGQIMNSIPGARVQILNHRLRPPQRDQLAERAGVYFDTARVEGTDGVPELAQSVPPGRILFGSHAPFLIPEAALVRVHESGRLENAAVRDICFENAVRMMGTTGA